MAEPATGQSPLITAAAVCLRWISHHGLFVLTLFAVAVLTALIIYLGQRTRYTRSSAGINAERVTAERVTADAAAVISLATISATLEFLGIYVVLVLT